MGSVLCRCGPLGLTACAVPRSKHTSSKQAAKHERVALSKAAESTQCDICQDRPAVLFCADDRALICRRCGGLCLVSRSCHDSAC